MLICASLSSTHEPFEHMCAEHLRKSNALVHQCADTIQYLLSIVQDAPNHLLLYNLLPPYSNHLHKDMTLQNFAIHNIFWVIETASINLSYVICMGPSIPSSSIPGLLGGGLYHNKTLFGSSVTQLVHSVHTLL
jgi:hypothetical protein